VSTDTELHALLDEALALKASNPPPGSRDRERINLLVGYIAKGLGVDRVVRDPWRAYVRTWNASGEARSAKVFLPRSSL
jgi:hypothetical protein